MGSDGAGDVLFCSARVVGRQRTSDCRASSEQLGGESASKSAGSGKRTDEAGELAAASARARA
ncbi:MAG: hypothetical protein ACREJX_17980, partial [Polyangiaceae bacterium]